MIRQRTFLLLTLAILAIVALSLLPTAEAFGAGNVPSYSAMEGKAFRHGDFADTLRQMSKKVGKGLFSSSSKFSGLDVSRIYAANFWTDYSQAMDVAALEKLPKQTILTIVMVLSFLSLGYATDEFEVTEERLGVYRCEAHIDNPKGYGDGKNPRQLDPRLRGPVDPRELEVDPRSGMKNYIANENGNWDTSSRYVRENLIRCIQLGRQARQSGDKATLHESFRLLGKSMHTMEDFPAHSNWCELALSKLGHRNVFLHVGDNCKIRAPDGTSVAPLVTGTFGGADFMHSMLGEASDHLSSASISDLAKGIDTAKQQQSQGNALSSLMSMIGKVPGGGGLGGDVSRDAESLSRGPAQDPGTMDPKQIYSALFTILAFHDRVAKGMSTFIEKVPGLESLLENVSNSLTTFTMTLIEPYVKPLMVQAMSGLHATSGAVVSGADQYEVYNNPNCDDPTHSQVSKDHFALILNEVAGNVAVIIDRHLVSNVVQAWDDEGRDPRQIADECLAPMFHPFFYHPGSAIQKEMLDYVARWAQEHPREIQRLDRQNCRNHTNTRSGQATEGGCGHGGGGSHAQGVASQETGFGPAMASYVEGKIGLPAGGLSFNQVAGGLTGRREIDDSQQQHGRYGSGGGGDDSGSGRRYGDEYRSNDDDRRGGSGFSHQSQHQSQSHHQQYSSSSSHHSGYDNQGGGSGMAFPEPQHHGHGGGGGYGSRRDDDDDDSRGGRYQQQQQPHHFSAPQGPPPGVNDGYGGGGGAYGGGGGGYQGGYQQGPPGGGFGGGGGGYDQGYNGGFPGQQQPPYGGGYPGQQQQQQPPYGGGYPGQQQQPPYGGGGYGGGGYGGGY
ncbi:unnamed protein product [Sympodiomycopsis kandeliae]